MTRTVLIASGKGGVGKTTLAAALSCALAARGRKVLALDLCRGMGSLDLALGMQEDALFSVGDIFSGARSVTDSAAPVHGYPGLRMLSAPAMDCEIPPAALLSLCREARRRDVDVIMDCETGLSPAFRAASCAADLALLLTAPEAPALRNLCWLSRSLTERESLAARLVVNRLPRDRREMRAVSPNIDAYMDETGLPLGGVIREDPSVRIAAAKGVPLLSVDKSAAQKDISAIAERILREDF